MANPNEWGPILWKIVHICSVNLGKERNSLLQKDQINYYNNFTKQIGFILPCRICRKHFYDYALKHKKTVEYDELKEYSIQYFLNLHNEVNKEKDKPKSLEVKEIKIGPNTSENDLTYRVKHISEFLKKGHKVRITMQFKGREVTYVSNGEAMILKLVLDVEEFGVAEAMPKLEGKKMSVIIRPKSNK